MGILEVIIFIAAICNFLLGFFVFLKDPSKRLNRLFGISSFITGIWVFTNFMMGIRKTLFWLKSAYAFGSLVPISATLWGLALCERKITRREIFLLSGVGISFFIISYINDFVVANVRRVYLGGFEGEMGPFFVPYWIYIFTTLTFILYILISTHYKAVGIKKLQIGYVLIGTILYISVVLIVSFILPLFEIKKFIPLDSPSSLFLLFFTALAITRYHLFEIRVILTEILVGVMGVVLIILPFLMPTFNLKILTFLIFLLFCIFGYLLIRHTHKEISYREEIQKAYFKLKEASKNIEELSKMKSEFLKIVSHQLRTPASIIKGMLSMMVEGSVKGEKLKEFIKKSYLSSERLTTILDDILVAQGLVGGGEPVRFSACQIEKIVQRQVEYFKPLAESKNLKIIFNKSKEPLPITLADPEMIERALSKLIDNALLYTEKGEIEVSINLKKKEDKDFIEISIKDSGIGLDEEDKKNLFKLFHRGEKATSLHPNGSGLGLFIVKELVKIHKGEIEAKSEGRGKGSNFIITLPVITEI